MKPDSPDIPPTDPKPNGAEPQAEAVLFDAHHQIQSIVVKATVAVVYGSWYRLQELPRFITSLRDVRKIDETHFAVTSALGDEERTTVLQIVLRIPERRIAWQAMSDSFPRGVVLFEALSDQMTQISVKLRSNIEPATLAKATREYLTNFKHFVEGRD